MLELRAASAVLGERRFRFDLQVDRGAWVAIIGPSGAGKSTLLNLIAGFVPTVGGVIEIDGRDVTGLPPARRPVTTLFQDHNLFVHLTVAQNVGLGLDPALRLSTEQKALVDDALLQVGLAGRGEARPGALSGGERQRVGLARALVRRRPVLLLDEPLSQLDPATRHDMLDRIADLHGRGDLTILMVLHTPGDAAERVDRFLLVDDGRIGADFDPDTLGSGNLPQPVLRYLGELREELPTSGRR